MAGYSVAAVYWNIVIVIFYRTGLTVSAARKKACARLHKDRPTQHFTSPHIT